MKLGIATPVVTNVAGAPLTWEKDAIDRGHRPRRRDGGSARLPPPHVQRAHRHARHPRPARRGARYWDPLATFGYVAARTDADPARHHDAGARLSPSAGDRKALRHTGSRQRRPGDPRASASARSRRSSTCSARRSTIEVPAATMRCGRCGQRCRAMSRPTTASTTRSAGSPSIRARYSRTCRSGSAAAPSARCGAQPSRSPTAGARSTSRSTPRRSGCKRVTLPPGFEVVLMPADQPLDPVGEPAATKETLRRWPQAARRLVCARSSITRSSTTSSRSTRSPNCMVTPRATKSIARTNALTCGVMTR